MIDPHEINQVVNAYLPLFEVKVATHPAEGEGSIYIDVVVNERTYSYQQAKQADESRQWKHFSKNAVYDSLADYTGHRLPWGSHTGVRPVSLAHQLHRQGREVAKELGEKYRFSPDKIELVQQIAGVQRPLLNTDPRALDVYIGIPFCVSRCSYCSFSLVGIEKKGKLQQPYTHALCREILEVGQDAMRKGYRPRCVYIGGGTPTALEDGCLGQLLDTVNRVFPQRRELTLEAGRPDTITPANLQLAKQAGVSRLSINPQTMHERTLSLIGRRHSPQDIRRALTQARDQGFENINMDLIAGLPQESAQDFVQTLDWVVGLRPESITVHTLALKRSSALRQQDYALGGSDAARQMLQYAYQTLKRTEYRPYYLYRQKYMEGNGENVGFALPGRECVYNIDVMEENTQVLALGSGGVSKRLDQGKLTRRSDPKDVEVYLERIDHTIACHKNFF